MISKKKSEKLTLQAYLGDSSGLVLNHCKKVDIAVKQGMWLCLVPQWTYKLRLYYTEVS